MLLTMFIDSWSHPWHANMVFSCRTRHPFLLDPFVQLDMLCRNKVPGHGLDIQSCSSKEEKNIPRLGLFQRETKGQPPFGGFHILTVHTYPSLLARKNRESRIGAPTLYTRSRSVAPQPVSQGGKRGSPLAIETFPLKWRIDWSLELIWKAP